MSILEDLSGIKPDLVDEIGDFEIVVNHQNESLLIKNRQGLYFTITRGRKGRITVEDISWIVDGILLKKKKQKYFNKNGINGVKRKDNGNEQRKYVKTI